MHKTKNKIMKRISPILMFVSVLLVWELLVMVLDIQEYILPSPFMIFTEIFTNLNELLYHTSITMSEALAGFLIANTLALIFAVIFIHSKSLEKSLYPYIIGLRVSPVIAIAPLLVIWFGTGLMSKIVCSAILCFFPTLVNLTKGLRAVDNQLLDLFKSFSSNKLTTLWKLRLPNSLPYLFSAFKISIGLAIAGAIIGEFVGSNKGIGYIIQISSYYLETTQVFAALFVIGFVGASLFYLVSHIEKKIVFWHTE